MSTDSLTTIRDMSETLSGSGYEAIPNLTNRQSLADKCIAVCSHFSHRPLEDLVCLDLGASTSLMTEKYAEYFKKVIAINPVKENLQFGRAEITPRSSERIFSGNKVLVLPDESVDVVICNQVYKHVDSQQGLMSEIYRVLKYDGFCYFGAGNRYVMLDDGYKLPLASCLPGFMARLYSRIFLGKKIDLKPLSLRKLKKLARNFWRHDYTRLIMENPHDFHADDILRRRSFFTHLPGWFYRGMYPWLPAWVWVLTKRK